MPRTISAGRISDFAPDSAKLIPGDEPVALFYLRGELYACSARCPHAGALLHDGFVAGTIVTCPWHGWSFDLSPGPDAPKDGLVRYAVRVVDGEILVELP